MVEGMMGLLIAALASVSVLSLVVVVHEFGHFIVARRCGVAVKSFSLGWGSPLISRTDRHGTVWKVSQIPIGGFVSFLDDADPTSSRPAPENLRDLDPQEARRRGYLRAQSVGVRAMISAAGPLVNFLFALVAFALLAMIVGKDVTDTASLSPRIDVVRADGPAEVAGLAAGDVVVAIDGVAVGSFGSMQKAVQSSPGKTLTLEVRREGEHLDFPVSIGRQKLVGATGIESEIGLLGVERRTAREEIQIKRLNPLEALGEGAGRVWGMIAQTGQYLGNLFTGRASSEHIMGPLGIFDVSGKVANGALAEKAPLATVMGNLALSLLNWAAALSVAVGFANLLPIPALDGGQLVLNGIEAIRRKPLSARAQEIGFQASFAMIVSLFLFATWNDLQRFKLLEFVGRILS
ncbi:MAG: RIP metalloprotease [Hyphomonadaceae bacterium]|nr:MAG: regulator of sigma E protease [Caulobacteraceae bacterium]MBT9445066.1 RIP metalloprotease [Hyphomonadaceae bacterium]TPW08927.1 MAG: regulator of sigma E protease [Alphaproteobacteria bacterium]